MPWWGVVLLCLGCLVAGGLVVYLRMMVYLGKGLRG